MTRYTQIQIEEMRDMARRGVKKRQIALHFGCSPSTVVYHTCDDQVGKYRDRRQVWLREVPAGALSSYKIRHNVYTKCRDFQRRDGSSLTDKVDLVFSLEDALKKVGDDPVCYLSGALIDMNDPASYSFDHIVPVAKGGTNTLDNLGIASKEANMAKAGLTLDEFKDLCAAVLRHQGYTIIPPAR